MQAIGYKEVVSQTSWMRRFLVKSALLRYLVAEHRCNVPRADYSPMLTDSPTRFGTYVCCECGQHWQQRRDVWGNLEVAERRS
jgi:hypothetical protein